MFYCVVMTVLILFRCVAIIVLLLFYCVNITVPLLFHFVTIIVLILFYCVVITVPLCRTPCGRGTLVSIVSCRCTYCFSETTHGKITRHYSRFCAVAFCYGHKCELSYIYPGCDVKLHPHQVKL